MHLKRLICFVLYVQFSFSATGQTSHYWSIQKQQDSIYIFKNKLPFLPFAVTEISSFNEGKAWYSCGGKYGYVDTNGVCLTDTLYNIVYGYQNGFAIVARDSLFGAINSLGEEIAAPYYDQILAFQANTAVVQKDGYWGLIDSAGNEILEPSADEPLIRLTPNHWAMKYRGFWGVLNKDLNVIYPFKYDCILKNGTAFEQSKKTILNL